MTTATALSALTLYPIFGSYVPLLRSDVEKLAATNGPVSTVLLQLFENYGCAGFTDAVSFKGEAGSFPIAYLLGGGDSSYAVNVVADQLRSEQNNSLIPFGGDEFGNYFLCSSKAPDSVWRWNHEQEWVEGTNPIQLAEGLEAFFQRLR